MGRKHKYELPDSLERAVELFKLGLAPPRPRNELEVTARKYSTGRRLLGRPTNPTSKSQMAIELASYLMLSNGLTARKASEIAAQAYGLSSSDNLRRGIRKNMRLQTVQISHKTSRSSFFGQLVKPRRVPFFLGAIDAESGEISNLTSDPDGAELMKSWRDDLIAK